MGEVQKVIFFNGVKYSLMGSGKYYLASHKSNEDRKKAKGLHVAVWEYHNQKEVPKGFHVHHIDGNNLNNSIENLEILSVKEHRKKHPIKDREKNKKQLDLAREKAIEWHKSEEGRKWHSEHAKKIAQNYKLIDKKCKNCGENFKAKYRTAVFCSDGCGERYRGKRKRPSYTRKCVSCGEIFTKTKYKQSAKESETCSTSCGAKLAYARRTKV